MEELVNLIIQLISETNDACSPMIHLFGTVTKTKPLTIDIDEKYPIYGSSIILTERFTGDNALKVRDRVLLLRCKGGQQHIVLDRLK